MVIHQGTFLEPDSVISKTRGGRWTFTSQCLHGYWQSFEQCWLYKGHLIVAGNRRQWKKLLKTSLWKFVKFLFKCDDMSSGSAGYG